MEGSRPRRVYPGIPHHAPHRSYTAYPQITSPCDIPIYGYRPNYSEIVAISWDRQFVNGRSTYPFARHNNGDVTLLNFHLRCLWSDAP
eukprot:3792104-Pleurochrysis_carterae.AAC.1